MIKALKDTISGIAGNASIANVGFRKIFLQIEPFGKAVANEKCWKRLHT